MDIENIKNSLTKPPVLAGGLAVIVVIMFGVMQFGSQDSAAACAAMEEALTNVAIAQSTYHEETQKFAPDIETLANESDYAEYMVIGEGVVIVISSVTDESKRTLIKEATKSAFVAVATHPSCKDETGMPKVYRWDSAADGLQK